MYTKTKFFINKLANGTAIAVLLTFSPLIQLKAANDFPNMQHDGFFNKVQKHISQDTTDIKTLFKHIGISLKITNKGLKEFAKTPAGKLTCLGLEIVAIKLALENKEDINEHFSNIVTYIKNTSDDTKAIMKKKLAEKNIKHSAERYNRLSVQLFEKKGTEVLEYLDENDIELIIQLLDNAEDEAMDFLRYYLKTLNNIYHTNLSLETLGYHKTISDISGVRENLLRKKFGITESDELRDSSDFR